MHRRDAARQLKPLALTKFGNWKFFFVTIRNALASPRRGMHNTAMALTLVTADSEPLRLQASGRIMHSQISEEPDSLRVLTGPNGYARKVLVSLEQVRYIDSAGIGWLLSSHKRFQKSGGKLVLHSVPESVMLTLRVLRLDTILNIAESEAAAMALAQ
jgi:anti-anti-sigma factor